MVKYKKKKPEYSIEYRKDKHALEKFASDHLTFENQDYATNALDFTFNMTLTRQSKEEEIKQKIATTPKNEGFQYKKGCVSHVSTKNEA